VVERVMTAAPPKNAPKNVTFLKGPTVVRYCDASRFLWGDPSSGEVADVIYGRNELVGTLIYKLRPGACFTSSDSWKAFFDQHRFYYVLRGQLTVKDPESGEVAVADVGEAVHWRGAKWHFGYNFTNEECVVLDWYAPQERPAHVSELEFGATKPKFQTERAGRSDLLGRWPDALDAARVEARSNGGMITATKRDALHFVHGRQRPVLESLFVSTAELTAGVVDLVAGAHSENRSHPSDKVIFVTDGKLHVYLPDTFDWFELDEWDLLYLPPATQHQYWNYTDRPVSFAFMVVPRYE
jgi:oxalate decarboxylase/phosphoglucose isomerase-like protein (cupin superfamily)